MPPTITDDFDDLRKLANPSERYRDRTAVLVVGHYVPAQVGSDPHVSRLQSLLRAYDNQRDQIDKFELHLRGLCSPIIDERNDDEGECDPSAILLAKHADLMSAHGYDSKEADHFIFDNWRNPEFVQLAVLARQVKASLIGPAGRLLAFIRAQQPGNCRMPSRGESCLCPLCDVARLMDQIELLKSQIQGHVERIAKQSDLLTKRAET